MELSIGTKIRKVREIKNFGQKYLAEKLGISQSSYSDLESGKTKVTDSKLGQIAAILEVKIETIKNYNDNMVFNSASGTIERLLNYPDEKIHQLYEQLLKEKDAQIYHLKEIIRLKDKGQKRS